MDDEIFLTVSTPNIFDCRAPNIFSPVLFIEVVHIGNQVFDNVHVRQRINLGSLVIGFNLGQTGEGIHTSCNLTIS